MGSFGATEMLVVAVFALLVFGPRKLPELARSAGRALQEFKRVTSEMTEDLKAEFDEPVWPMPAEGWGAGPGEKAAVNPGGERPALEALPPKEYPPGKEPHRGG